MRANEFITEAESYQPPSLSVGDKILKGKFKNSPAEIKGFTKDKHNQPVLKTNKGEVQLFKPRVSKLMKEDEVVTELFDPKTSFPLQWDNQFSSSGEVHAEAYDADSRIINISFTPTGTDGVIEIYFTRGGSYDLTGRGDAPRVLSTVVNAINIYLEKYKPPYIAFSAKTTGGRASAYTAMIKRLARNYTLLTPQDYPEDEEVIDFLNSLGSSDKPFILARL